MIWKSAKLGDICKIQTGNSIPVKEKKVLYKNIDEGLPYVATKDVGFDGVINYDNGVRIPQSIVLNLSYLKEFNTCLWRGRKCWKKNCIF